MDYLEGGRVHKIVRIGETVHRPAGEWTPYIHNLLNHIRSQGFLGVPEPFGFDNEGNEIVSFISGEVSNYPLSKSASSIEALVSAAKLLRAYHDASASFTNKLQGDESWWLPVQEPIEVVCHGDYAPYNVVLQGNKAVAIIDFDTAHPGPRVWDIAFAIYRWAPLTKPDNSDHFGEEQRQIERARLFCDAYGLTKAKRDGLIAMVIKRLRVLIDFMHSEANSGNEAFKTNIADGHHLSYLADIKYLKVNGGEIQENL